MFVYPSQGSMLLQTTWETTWRIMNRNITPKWVLKSTFWPLTVCFKTMDIKILRNSIWGDPFLYQRSIRLNLYQHTAAFSLPGAETGTERLCPEYWAQTLLFVVNPPCPLDKLISILLFFDSSHFNFFSPFTFTKLLTSISVHSPILFFLTMPSPFSSYFPSNELCVSPEGSNPHKDPNDPENT